MTAPDDSQSEADRYVPYAPDFTPATLGKTLGEDAVLPWLLTEADQAKSRAQLQERIIEFGLQHVEGASEEKRAKNRRDMAGHVVTALSGYQLISLDKDQVELTDVGRRLLDADDEVRDRLFAVHILTRCNGMRLVEAIRLCNLRNEEPSLENLANELDRGRTAKSISSMKAWLARAGVLYRHRYRVNEAVLSELLGKSATEHAGLTREELEFLLTARRLALGRTDKPLLATDVAAAVEERDVVLSRKSLSNFVRNLEKRGWISRTQEMRLGSGGKSVVFTVCPTSLALEDDELRDLLKQLDGGISLADLPSLADVWRGLAGASGENIGQYGEMLAIHLCMMLGLRLEGWRSRAPHSEIDLVAERTASLTYQRWAIQVKNTASKLDTDQVDREIGAVAGTGVSHILFVVPRAGASRSALEQRLHKSQLTSLHIYVLTAEAFGDHPEPKRILDALRAQQHEIADAKRAEIVRRTTRAPRRG